MAWLVAVFGCNAVLSPVAGFPVPAGRKAFFFVPRRRAVCRASVLAVCWLQAGSFAGVGASVYARGADARRELWFDAYV